MAVSVASDWYEKLAWAKEPRIECGSVNADIGSSERSADGGGDFCGPKFHDPTLRDVNRVHGRRTTVRAMSGPDRTRLVVLFGGQSAEHDVSRVTARHVLTAADPDRYDIVAIGITREGTWVQCSTDVASFGDALEIKGDTVNAFSVLTPDSVVFPLLHGPMGEDGTLQGLLEIAGVPFVGSAVLGSSLSMDKIISKHIADAEGFTQTKWRGMHANELTGPASEAVLDALSDELGFPMFVKPANMGSSIGVAKVTERAALRAAIDDALRYDEWLVLEEGVN